MIIMIYMMIIATTTIIIIINSNWVFDPVWPGGRPNIIHSVQAITFTSLYLPHGEEEEEDGNGYVDGHVRQALPHTILYYSSLS